MSGGSGVIEEIKPSGMKPPSEPGTVRIVSWNVNGIRSVAKKGFTNWFHGEDADIVCLQETKAQPEQLEADKTSAPILALPGYTHAWHSAEKKGYSGTAIFSRPTPIRSWSGFEQDDGSRSFNSEGRIVVAEYSDYFLWNVYFPNGQRGPDRVAYKLAFYDHCLRIWEEQRRTKAVVICGDFNTAHYEIDLARPKENAKNSGFLPEERAFLDKIESLGYVDTFRMFNREPEWYTYWDPVTFARSRNVGWRIDYFWVNREARPRVKKAYIEKDVMGSDHCPVGILWAV